MPTGGGKSITFQVPALLLPGITIVVTPLISLMKDQVDNLKKRNIKAATLYSGMTLRERNLAYDRARLGKLKLLYVSPERLRSENFRTEMRGWNVSLIVVDEAHCISQWGYDFRPSYLRIADLRATFGDAPILALTASATPVVREDIVRSLNFGRDYKIYSLSFHRHNLSYIVRHDLDKESKLIDSLTAVPGSAIVYVRSRLATAKYAEALSQAGISATFYHAGLDANTKAERQQQWKENKVRVMVATNAFGMGIDKPDVRVVVHLDVPPSLEEYYQEAGRAGRDGKKSYALLLATVADKAKLTKMLNAAFPPKDFIIQVYEKACVFMDIPVGEGFGHVYEFDPVKFSSVFKLNQDSVRGALTILTNAGYFDYNEDPTTRGRVQILVRREDFYHIPLPEEEQGLINALLRLYPGLFSDYVYISEENLASQLGLTRENVYQILLTLTRKKILHYIPKRVLPYIYLPTSREESKYITIPKSIYEERRALMLERIDSVRRFAFSADECRDRILLQYFGEEVASDCGMCDFCVEKRKMDAKVTKNEKERENDLMERIKTIIYSSETGTDIRQLLKQFKKEEDLALNLLQRLLNKDLIVRKGNKLYPVKC